MTAPWLADALRADPVLAGILVEEPGWQSRGRPPSTGQFTPGGVLSHHTACMNNPGHNGRGCALGCRDGRSDLPGPISQLHLGFRPTPRLTVIAAGRANHGNGQHVHVGVPWAGGSKDWSRHTVGLEVCGPAAHWEDAWIDLYARTVAALLRHMNAGADHVFTHASVNSNKIDPSGPWKREPTLARLRPWNLAAWRAEVTAHLHPTSDPNPHVQATQAQVAASVHPSSTFPGSCRRGDHGPVVLAWQYALVVHGVIANTAGNRDGVFGAGLDGAVRRFQQAHHLAVDGIAGAQTWHALTG